jgi:hypothetical protein
MRSFSANSTPGVFKGVSVVTAVSLTAPIERALLRKSVGLLTDERPRAIEAVEAAEASEAADVPVALKVNDSSVRSDRNTGSRHRKRNPAARPRCSSQ